MFGDAAVSISSHHRASGAHFLSEVVATLGLILVIFALARSDRTRSAPAAVGAYIGAAYFFTSSTSFANPAITVGRMMSNTFAGIAPSSVPNFVLAQVVGGLLAFVVIRVLYPGVTSAEASDIIMPHHLEEKDEGPSSQGIRFVNTEQLDSARHDGARRSPARFVRHNPSTASPG